tara:strand:- start:520 stop:915 length:396 start_codon:yes stop_codon:yes gene_type:complete
MSIAKVNAKLYKSKKVDLKTRKVSLNKLNEIEEALSTSGIVYYVLEEDGLDEAIDTIRNADSFIDHQFRQDYNYADELLTELETTMDELGLPYPSELVEYRQQYTEQATAINELIDTIDFVKNNIGGQSKY